MKKNKARVVFRAFDIPTWPDICPIKILSNNFRQYVSYSLHKISAQGEISTWHAYWSLFMPLPNIIKIFQTIMKLLSAQELDLEI